MAMPANSNMAPSLAPRGKGKFIGPFKTLIMTVLDITHHSFGNACKF